jgi:hypothetical protein
MNFLSTEGKNIVDQDGRVVRLRGTCVGGWMNMEDFVNGYSGAEHTLRHEMATVLGASRAEFFFERLLDQFFNESDFEYMRSLGTTVVRLPLNYRHFEDDRAPYVYKEAGFVRLDRVLGWCEKHGLYAILDLHAVQGWQNAPTPVKESMSRLAQQVYAFIEDDSLDRRFSEACFSQSALCFFTGALMQRTYATLFQGMSEKDMDQTLSSFSRKRCIVNQSLEGLVRKYTASEPVPA